MPSKRIVGTREAVVMVIAAFVVGLLGLVVAAASVGWQVHTWLASAPRVTVTTFESPLLVKHDSGELVPQPSGGIMISVIVRNTGRMPISVERWGFQLSGHSGELYDTLPDTIDGLPCLINPHHTKTFMQPKAPLIKLLVDRGLAHGRAFARMSNGEQIFAQGPPAITAPTTNGLPGSCPS